MIKCNLFSSSGPEHPWLIKAYIESAPYPYADVTGQEIFQTGLIPSDTDYRIFRDYGHIPGNYCMETSQLCDYSPLVFIHFCLIISAIAVVLINQGCQGWTWIGSDWPQMGQIWNFLTSVSVHFGSSILYDYWFVLSKCLNHKHRCFIDQSTYLNVFIIRIS